MTMCEIFIDLLADFIMALLAYFLGYYKGRSDELDEWLNWCNKKSQGDKNEKV